jgi:hypothetical protein
MRNSMANFIRLRNQIVDLEAIQYVAFVRAGTAVPDSKTPSSLHLIVGGIAVDLDQDDDADALWAIIVERLRVEWIDEPPPAPYA